MKQHPKIEAGNISSTLLSKLEKEFTGPTCNPILTKASTSADNILAKAMNLFKFKRVNKGAK
jgi:hypothetical protein